MKIGFAGLGAIGTPMADRCAAREGFAVWNRTATKAEAFATDHPGVSVARTPREVAAGMDAVITCLPTSGDVAALLEGVEFIDKLALPIQRGAGVAQREEPQLVGPHAAR